MPIASHTFDLRPVVICVLVASVCTCACATGAWLALRDVVAFGSFFARKEPWPLSLSRAVLSCPAVSERARNPHNATQRTLQDSAT